MKTKPDTPATLPPAIDKTGLCLSIQQPWAWLIVRPDITDVARREIAREHDLIKGIENRDWPTRVRGWIGIHAGKKLDVEGIAWVRETFPEIRLPEQFYRGGLVGRAFLSTCVTTHPSRWFTGRYGFVLTQSEPMQFTPCRGMLGFFRPSLTPSTAPAHV